MELEIRKEQLDLFGILGLNLFTVISVDGIWETEKPAEITWSNTEKPQDCTHYNLHFRQIL